MNFLKMRFAFYNYLLLTLAAFILFSCSPVDRFEDDKADIGKIQEIKNDKLKNINVLLSNDYNGKTLKFTSETILQNLSHENLINILENQSLSIQIYNSKIKINLSNGSSFLENGFYIVSKNSFNIIDFEGRNYRGKIKIIYDEGKARVINYLSTEDYLKGVVPAEYGIANSSSDYEALKAFCIVARTYAYSKIYSSRRVYDVRADISDQVYKGFDYEKEISSSAVEATNQIALFYNGVPAQTFYHSSCGGQIEDVASVFSDGDYPYLRNKNDLDKNGKAYCSIAPKFEWIETFSESKIKSNLKNYDSSLDIANIKDVYIESKFPSGRVKYLAFKYLNSKGEIKIVKLYGNNIRFIMLTESSNSSLRSSMFEINKEISQTTGNLNKLELIGKGYGHGVGFCQYGALGRSRNGQKYDEILKYYFPLTYMVKIE